MNIYREVVNRIEIPALPSLESGYYLLRFERNGTTSNVYAVVENESGMGVPITASLTEIGTGTPDPESGEVLLAPGPWTLFFYEQVSGTNTNPDCSTIPLGQTEVTVYGEDAAVLSQAPTDCPSGPGGTVNAEDVTVTPYIYINAGSGAGAYRNNGNTADGRIVWELVGGDPDEDGIFPVGSQWELAVGGTVMYTSDNYPTDIQDVTGWTIANGLAPTPSISPDYGDDVQEQLEGLAGAVEARQIPTYKALLSQAGTDAPTVVVLQNTLGYTWVWTRLGTGSYRGTPSTLLDPAKTALQITGTSLGILCTALVDFEDEPGTIYVGTYSPGSTSPVDTSMFNTTFTVEVYP